MFLQLSIDAILDVWLRFGVSFVVTTFCKMFSLHTAEHLLHQSMGPCRVSIQSLKRRVSPALRRGERAAALGIFQIHCRCGHTYGIHQTESQIYSPRKPLMFEDGHECCFKADGTIFFFGLLVSF